MVTCTSPSLAETLRLAGRWGLEARPGWVIGLAGELGAGKTQLARGLAQGLGVTERVHSPTYALVHEYRSGRLPLFHLDLYRLETWAQFESAGLEAYLYEPPGIAVVEWFDRCDSWVADGIMAQPGPRLRRVWIEPIDASSRMIRYEDSGP